MPGCSRLSKQNGENAWMVLMPLQKSGLVLYSRICHKSNWNEMFDSQTLGQLLIIGFLIGLVLFLTKRLPWQKPEPKEVLPFRTREKYLNAQNWDEKSCPECGRKDLIINDRQTSNSRSTINITESAIIRNSEGDETGSIDFNKTVPVTERSVMTKFTCCFCLYSFSFSVTRRE